MNGKHAWRRQSVLWLALLSFLICVLAIRPWTRVGAAGAVPLAPMSIKHTTLGDVRVYDRAAALALPGVQVQRVKANPSYSKTQATPYAQAHQDVSGSHSLTVGAELVLLYWFGNFLCGFGVATASTDPIWAYADEVGFLYVDGTAIDGTASGGFASTADETGCDNPGAPGGAYWKMLTEAGATWFDGTVIDGSAATYQVQ
jgi:hypothetical protein